MTSDNTNDDVLTFEQKQRALALRIARGVLVERGALSSGRVSSVVDLVTIAQWIMDGKDPWPVESDVDAKSNHDEDSLTGPDGQPRYTLHHDRVEGIPDAEPSREPADEGVEADR